MYKSFIVGIMLLNYFLVVVVTNITTVHAVKYTQAYSTVNPYVHAPDCQQRFYLQFDCFDACYQQEQLNTPATPINSYLVLSTIGLDFHFAWPVPVNCSTFGKSVRLLVLFTNQSPVPGFTSLIDPPPLGFNAV